MSGKPVDSQAGDELELVRQTIDDSMLTHTGRSIGDRASEEVARDVMTVLESYAERLATERAVEELSKVGQAAYVDDGYTTVADRIKELEAERRQLMEGKQ